MQTMLNAPKWKDKENVNKEKEDTYFGKNKHLKFDLGSNQL